MRAIFSSLSAAVLTAVWLGGSAVAQTPPSLGGCPVLPADNVWNTPVDGLPVDANSSAYIARIGPTLGLHPDFGAGLWDGGPIGIPFNIVPGTQPKVSIAFDYWDESDPGPYPIPPNPAIEGGSGSTGDRHILALDRDHCVLHETWSTYPQSDGSWYAGSGAIFDLRANGLRPSGWTSADAAGLPVLPGLVRYEEVAAGEINHALRFTVPATRRAYVWPARHYASSITDPSYPPMGQRFRLKSSFDISGYSADVQVILRALKKYGMILADNGSAWYLSGAPDEGWANDVLVRELRTVLGSNFEAVDESSLMLSPDSGQARQAGGPDTQAPTAPTGLAATVVSSYRIDLSWNSSDDNVGVTGYIVYRNGVKVATTPGLVYSSTGLTPATSYTFRVAAYDAAGNISAQSAAVTKTTLPASSTAFAVGDSVRTAAKTSVRSEPSGSGLFLGNQAKGASGKVTAGPVYWNNQWWWRVDFTRNPDGWVTETKIRKVS